MKTFCKACVLVFLCWIISGGAIAKNITPDDLYDKEYLMYGQCGYKDKAVDCFVFQIDNEFYLVFGEERDKQGEKKVQAIWLVTNPSKIGKAPLTEDDAKEVWNIDKVV
jgi:hypothetical protein